MCLTGAYDQPHTPNDKAKRWVTNNLVKDEIIDNTIATFERDMKIFLQ
jgi:hypothetical protein